MFGRVIGIDLSKGAEVSQSKREVIAYASAFGNVDAQGERVRKGAFAKSIAERLPEGQIKLFRNHWEHIGVVREAEEDDFGLLTRSYISKTPAGDAALEQLLDGSLSRYSFRGTVIRAGIQIEPNADGEPMEILELTEIKLKEVGPVDLDPANPLARVLSVKSLDTDALDALTELPNLVTTFKLDRDRKLSGEELRVVKSLLRLHGVIGERRDVLEALLQAPDRATPRHAEPVEKSTRADANETPLVIPETLLELARNRGRIS